MGHQIALILLNRAVETTHKLMFGLLHLVSPEERVSLDSFPGVLVVGVSLPTVHQRSGHGDKLRLVGLH